MNQYVLLIACGDRYVDFLVKNYKKIPSNYTLIIYTSDVEIVKHKIKNSDVRKYEHSKFRYFDKFSIAYTLTNELKTPILYADVGRILEIPPLFWKLDLNTISEIHHMGNWGELKTAHDLINHISEYFEESYFNNILSYFSSNIDLKRIPTILERVFVLPYNKQMKKVLYELEKLRPLFEHTSLTKMNTYSGIGNGEGLALGYSIVKSETNIVNILDTDNIKKQII